MKDKQFKFELLPNDIKENRFGFISIRGIVQSKTSTLCPSYQNVMRRINSTSGIVMKNHNAYNEKTGYIVCISKPEEIEMDIHNITNQKLKEIAKKYLLEKYYASFENNLGFWYENGILHMDYVYIILDKIEALRWALKHYKLFIFNLQNQQEIDLEPYDRVKRKEIMDW